MATAVDKWPASARLSAVAPAGHLPTAPTPRAGTRPGGQIVVTFAPTGSRYLFSLSGQGAPRIEHNNDTGDTGDYPDELVLMGARNVATVARRPAR